MGNQKRLWMKGVALVLTASVLSAGVPAVGQYYDPDEELPRPTGIELRLEKLGRGLSNVLFGWTEIPVTMDRKLREGKPLTYLLSTAPVLGSARAVMRTTTGVFEVVTFPFSDQDVNFAPILEPDYIF